MLQVKLLAVDRIQPQSNEFAMGVENEATGVSKFNDSLLWSVLSSCFSFVFLLLGPTEELEMKCCSSLPNPLENGGELCENIACMYLYL